MNISKTRIESNRTKRWLEHGSPHKKDGSAIEYAVGTKFWFKNGKLHREDGPAVETPIGENEWWLNGKQYTEIEFRMLQFAKGINTA